jgi:Wiskott-Aldrich syndrome protein
VDNLLADIRGGARLKRVSSQEKRDRSAAMVPGGEPAAAGGAAGGAAPNAAEGGLAGALASALAARKAKVSHSGEFYPIFHVYMFKRGRLTYDR